MKIYLIFFYFYILIRGRNCEIFSATSSLISLHENEAKVIKETRDLINDLKNLIFKLERDFEEMEKEHERMTKNKLEYISNPLNAFLLIKRLSVDVLEREKEVSEIGRNFLENVKGQELSREDFEGAVDGLIRLQIIYELSSEDLAQGVIDGQKYREDLSARDLLSIGDEMMRTENFIMSLSYLNLSLYKNRETQEMSEIKILESIYNNYNNSGDVKSAISTADEIIKIDPTSEYQLKKIELEIEILFDDDDEYYESLGDDEEDLFKKDGQFSEIKEFKFTADACNNKLKKSEKEISQLFCRYNSRFGHFSTIAPFKVEDANLHPYVAIIHDLMSDKEADKFVELSNPTMKRAGTLNKNATESISNIRVAKHSWHTDNSHKIFKTMTDRVADMTGLNMDTAEQWQTQNYGIGGHYKAHYDFVTEDSAPFSTGNGNRIATVLVYLSEVEKEGATIFPFLSLRVAPKKGSAVFWFNLSSSGDLEYLTRHSGCPVMVGSKWVANKWIHEHGQEFHRPCELFPSPTDPKYFKKFY